MRKVALLAALTAISLSLTACGESSSVSTEENKPATTQQTQEQGQTSTQQDQVSPTEQNDDTKKVSISKDFRVNGLDISLGEAGIKSDGISLGMTIRNTTKNKLTFYPDQGNIVVGNMQLEANMFLNDGDVSGEIQPGVEKSGIITFKVPDGKTLDPNEITSIQLHLGNIMNHKTFESKEFDQALQVNYSPLS